MPISLHHGQKSGAAHFEGIHPFNALYGFFAGGEVFDLKAGTSSANFVDKWKMEEEIRTASFSTLSEACAWTAFSVTKKRGGRMVRMGGSNGLPTFFSTIDYQEVGVGGAFIIAGITLSAAGRGAGASNSTYAYAVGKENPISTFATTTERVSVPDMTSIISTYALATAVGRTDAYATQTGVYTMGGMTVTVPAAVTTSCQRLDITSDASTFVAFGVLGTGIYWNQVQGNTKIICSAAGTIAAGTNITTVQRMLTSHNATTIDFAIINAGASAGGGCGNDKEMFCSFTQAYNFIQKFNYAAVNNTVQAITASRFSYETGGGSGR